MKRLGVLAAACALGVGCDVVSVLGSDPAAPVCDGGTCSDSGSCDCDAGDTDGGDTDSGTPDSGAPDGGAPDGGAPDGGGCDSLSCAGCCQGNTCILLDNETATACGAQGQACQDCADGGICDNDSGTCAGESCGPGNCAGCCESNNCIQLANETSSECGANGLTCFSCGDAGCNKSNGTCL
jgi:hypothetical protein